MKQFDLSGRNCKEYGIEKKLSSSLTPVLKRCQSQVQDSSCQWKCCKSADRLSELPDDVLGSIMSRLRLKEAVRTSVLSPRWRNLWTYTTGTLDFHYSEELSISENFLLLYLSKEPDDKGRLLDKRSEFMDQVNRILSLHKGATIDKFEVFAKSYGTLREECMEKWVEFALRKKVNRLKLDFTFINMPGYFSITKPLLHKFESNLSCLTVLSLNNVEVTGQVIHYVLIKCSALEELHLENSSSLLKLKVPGPLPQLKCLKIISCDYLKRMEIHANNILSFAYDGLDIPITFKTAPQLVNASLCGNYGSYFVQNITKYSCYIKYAESLKLKLSSCNKYLSDETLPELPVFENLRVLELELRNFSAENTYNCCAVFLKKCPLLTRLSLSVCVQYAACDSKGGWCTKRSSECLHSQLKVVELTKFSCRFEDQQQVICSILSDLPSLDKVIVHQHPYWGEHFDHPNLNEFSNKLKMVLPPKAELIF